MTYINDLLPLPFGQVLSSSYGNDEKSFPCLGSMSTFSSRNGGEVSFTDAPSRKNLKYTLLIAGIICLVVMLVAGTVALMVLSRWDEEAHQREEFEFSTSIFITVLENIFHRWNRKLLQLRAVAELSYSPPTSSTGDTSSIFEEPLSVQQWEVYLRGVVSDDPDNVTYFTGWTAKVLLERRTEFESYVGKLYNSEEFHIIELSEDGDVVRAGIRPVYFPFAFLWPWREGRDISMDLASEARRKAILELAFEKDSPTVSEPINFVGNTRGVYFLLPAFDISKFPAMNKRDVQFACPTGTDESLSCNALLGFVTLLLRVDSAVEEAAELSLQKTHVRVTDLSINEVLTEYSPCDHPSSDDLQVKRIFTINNKQWQIDMRLCETQDYAYSKYKWFILAGAIVLSVVILLFMILLRSNAKKAIASHRAYRRAEIEREAEERNRLLAEEEREEADAARERAEELSRAKARFLNNMNRELRTPLSGVVGTIDILQNTLSKEVCVVVISIFIFQYFRSKSQIF